MFKLILISTLCFSALGFDYCWKNIGNQRSTASVMWFHTNTSETLDDCKNYCDKWSTTCFTYDNAEEGCDHLHCNAGVLTDEGCELYQESNSWYQVEDTSRDQAFEQCDPSCWLEHNGQEHIDEEVEIQTFEGEYSIPDCQSECVNYNAACELTGCELWCGGITTTDEHCIITIRFDVDTGLTYSNDANAHYREYTCEINLDPVPEEASTHVVAPGDEEDGGDEFDGGDFGSGHEDEEQEEEEQSGEQGSSECNQAVVYSECNYYGDSAVVNLVVEELDWEPKSFCVPEHQTLVLHNEFYLLGESASYTESVACTDVINYSFLAMNKLKKKNAANSHSVFTF